MTFFDILMRVEIFLSGSNIQGYLMVTRKIYEPVGPFEPLFSADQSA